MTLIVPPALVQTLLDKAALPPPLQAKVLGGALAQAVQQRQRSTATATETLKAVPRLACAERARETEEKRLSDEPRHRGDLLDVSA